MPLATIRDFVRHEAFGGVLLVAAAALALVFANTGLAGHYGLLNSVNITIKIGDFFALDKPILLWINDGLMAVFFLLVGLEIKRELVQGELSSVKRAALPAIAAAGGMALPAAIYVAINGGDPVALRGWAIPAATDIAFSLGVLALLGSRVPFSLKLFLLALAVLDDLGAIVIIALFYTADLSTISLLAGLGGLALLVVLNQRGVERLAPYLLIGILVWIFVLKSGVHATLAGVAVAFTIPLRSKRDPEHSPAGALEDSLHPSVAYVILPLFAFANAGVSLRGLDIASLLEPVPLGIALGLFLGKQLGIFATTWLAVKARLCTKPEGASWIQLYGVCLVAGIGFTMSLFIGTLAFSDPRFDAGIRLGVLGGSLLSAVGGYLLLRATLPRKAPAQS
ncbi:MAG: Na+/H+ antiporter NhaA [Rhodospirillaceae bacterium]|nr:Na+/H+ antiporter NhaA [Rhodospirillaceae bacterium]